MIAPILLSSERFLPLMENYRVFRNVLNCKKRLKKKVLYIGDSLGYQFFPPTEHENSLTINGYVLMIGHYILAYHAIQNNPDLEEVILVSEPRVLGFDFERSSTYGNVIKPFYTFENRPLFSDLVLEKMNKKPLSHLAIFSGMKVVRCFSDIEFEEDENKDAYSFSDVAIEYLKELKALTESKGIRLTIVPPPMDPIRIGKSNDWSVMRKQLKEEGLEEAFGDYFDRIPMVPKKHFKDPLHLHNKYLEANRDSLLREMVPNHLLDLVLAE